jgi:hypothetical protein
MEEPMPYPDNFDGPAFDRRYGTEADDDARAVAEACAAPHLANLARLRAAAKALVDLIDGAALPLEPGRGYDLQDVRAAAADLARADVTEFWARLVERRRGG